MEISSNDLNKIKKLIKSKLTQTLKEGESLELEVRFRTRDNDISYNQFRNILDKLTFSQEKGGLGLKNYKWTSRLDVKTKEDVRLSIQGIDNIKLYWLKNSLQFLKPEAYQFVKKKKAEIVDLDEYRTRVSLSSENEITDTEKTANVKNIKNSNSNKNFRLKNTYQVRSADGLFRYDLSSVKMSNASTLKKSGIFTQPIQNEIEMEYIGKPEIKASDVDRILESLVTNMNLMLSLIQDNHLLVNKSLEEEVIKAFLAKVGNNAAVINPVTANPVTLHPINLTSQGSINVLKDYAVTYKADGDRNMIYVYDKPGSVNHGTIYFISDTLGVRRTGYRREDWAGSIIEGELIKRQSLYLAYDMLWDGKTDIRDRDLDSPLVKKTGSNKPRLAILDQFLGDIESGTDFDDSRIADHGNLVKLEKKKYKYSTKKGDIFEKVKELQAEKPSLSYQVDGIIFTPIKMSYPKKPGKWHHLLKWKPVNQNSIDFLVRVEKNENNQEVINPLMMGKQVRQYKTLILHVGGYTQLFNKNVKKWNRKLEPVEFNPYNQDYDDAKKYNRANIILNRRGKMSFYDKLEQRWEEIHDDSIVEFVYDANRDEGFRWIPIKVRHDKTTKYKRGESMYGNYQDVANNIWESITKPVTIEMLTTGDIPSQYLEDIKNIGVEESYYKECQVSNYNSSKRLPYQNFHNLIVKMKLIQAYSPLGKTKTKQLKEIQETQGLLLDLACGKSGDLSKWKNARIKKVISVDIDPECIQYAQDFYQSYNSPKPLVTYLLGDSSKLIYPDYDIMMDKMDLKKYQESFPAKFMFDMVSLQFCLHYFFENELKLRTLLQNVNDNLKVGGYFLGTCFDGARVYQALKGKKFIEGKLDDDGEELIWKIEKKYKPFKFVVNKPNYGKTIAVYTRSIGHVHEEYLVNFEYLDTLMLEYGFEKVEVKSFGDIYAEENVEEGTSNIQKSSRMSGIEKEFSFLNNVFVYQKTKNTPDKVFTKLKKLMEKVSKE